MSNTPSSPNGPYAAPPSQPEPKRFVGSAAFFATLIGGVLVFVALCGVGTWPVAQNLLSGVLAERNPTGSNEPVTSDEIMPADAGSNGARVGALAPDFTLKDVYTGETVSLSDYRGQPVWINFWATWCPPCREEMPQMQKLYEEYAGRDLAIIGINVQETPDVVEAYITEGGYRWDFVIDETGKVVDSYAVAGIPSHFFVDREGVVRAVLVGPVGNADVEQYLRKIIP